MDNNTRKKFIKLVADKLTAAFEQVTLKATKEYHVSLGNFNEIHLIKNDATKSIFMGRVFETLDDNISVEAETKKIWTAIANYFRNNAGNTTPKQAVATPVETQTKPAKKRASKKAQEVEEVQPTPAANAPKVEDVNTEVDAKYSDDDGSTWVDSII